MLAHALFYVLILGASATNLGPPDDIVASLPGWSGPLPSTWYSGFLQLPQSTKQLHYLLTEAEAPLDPATAPLVLWLNGGPGCSSMEGLLYEHGPLVVSDAHAPPNINHDGAGSSSTNATALVRNKWAWSRAANVLYLEAPAGVGFSWATDKSELITGDNQTAYDNLVALSVFFQKFPDLRSNPFYVSGESYGGVYVPTLSLKIYQQGSQFPGNMQGYLVGNGVFDFEDAAATQVPFAYGHGMISTKLHTQLTAACASGYVHPSAQCAALLKQVASMSVDTNGYDVYRTCYDPAHTPTMGQLLSFSRAAEDRHSWLQQRSSNRVILASGEEAVPCINSVEGTAYLNRDDVRRALHVDTSPNTWQICGGCTYKDDGVYKSIVSVHQQLQAYSPRALVYNGDVDPGCNYLWAEASVAKIGPAEVEAWRPWVYDVSVVGEQLGGFVTAFEGNLTFATVHGAGHMSPQWRPEAVFNMLQRFLAGSKL
eukprot:TRINITY_DN49631_c0_g1_i2.p1 TRINITY_DN49631_c0_g1~~TRINITY_DN49631_c0_g1_i2.p1  ORF type:complete len:483 (+),score=84.11 TRINITY_DN49631_c0_g1_i2:193-1641(+)